MKKFFQKDWFGIKFNEFCEMNSNVLADVSFYASFYRIFFQKFRSFSDLPEAWRHDKEQVVDFVKDWVRGDEKILSIGCGLGYVEYCLSLACPNKIIVIEPSEGDVCRWLKDCSNISVIRGLFPDALSRGQSFTFGYSNALDYVFDQEDFFFFLSEVRKRVSEFLLFSASFDNDNLIANAKYLIKIACAACGFFSPGQFWGYLRTRKEYQRAFYKAGFKNIEDGFLSNGTYWIKGR